MSNLRSSQDSLESFTGSSFSTVENSEHHEALSQSISVSSQSISNDENCKFSGLEPKMMIVPGSGLEPNISELHKSSPALDTGHCQKPICNVVNGKKPTVANRSVDQTHSASALEQSAIHTPRPKEMPGYLANRRSASFAIHQEQHSDLVPSSILGNIAGSSSSMTIPSWPVKHTSSIVRLSLSLDGKARVITGADHPPSPPRTWSPHGFRRVEKRPGGGLQRSHSALEPHELPSAIPRRSMVGRSRDARTWEFYCDSEAGNTLTAQAELEKSGSAVAPIGLIRSGSNKAMRPNSNKRSVPSQNHGSAKKYKSGDHSTVKLKLGRAVSSVARLQTINGNEQRLVAKGSGKDPKHKLPSIIFEDEGGDSDKENWEPGTQRRPVQRRRAVQSPGIQRGVLQESPIIPNRSSSLESLLNREDSSPRSCRPKRKQLEEPGQENVQPEVYDEVRDFVQRSSVPRAVEDLEGVQNLLSLSRASWR